MRSLRRIAAPAVALALAAALLAGCEDNGVTAPSDGQLIVTASPTTVVINTELGETEGQTTVSAQLFDTEGFALEGVSIWFTTTAGRLASANTAVETDANGFALDVLTLEEGDDSTVTVTASSGTLSGSVSVDKVLDTGNIEPEAIITAPASGSSEIGQNVTFSGTNSSDPDGSITCFKWWISYKFDTGSGVETRTEVAQGQTRTSITREFNVEQFVTVKLFVSDDPDPQTFCDPFCTGTLETDCADPSYFSSESTDTLDDYEIVCDLSNPQVFASPDQTVALADGDTDGVDVTLGGSASDLQSGIFGINPATGLEEEGFVTWNCGNGEGDVHLAIGEAITCVYTTRSTFTATLTAKNGCGMTAVEQIKVTVQAP